jgi:diacylglycerol kinase family enzyme
MKTAAVTDSCVLVINPSRYPQYVRILRRLLKQHPGLEVVESKDREDFAAAVRRFHQSDYRYLLVWGGDGTVHLAINTLMAAEREAKASHAKSIGFLRGGSGNGYQDSYGVTHSIRRQLYNFFESMAHNYTIAVDLLKVSDGVNEVYGQLAGVGFDAAVIKLRQDLMQETGPNGPGVVHYTITAFRTFFKTDFKAHPSYQLWIDREEGPGQTAQPLVLVAGIRSHYGNHFKICPDAICNDGLLDLYLFNFDQKLPLLANIGPLWLGRHSWVRPRFTRSGRPMIEHCRARQVTLASPVLPAFHVDGELPETETFSANGFKLTITAVPRAISFLVPPAFYHKLNS